MWLIVDIGLGLGFFVAVVFFQVECVNTLKKSGPSLIFKEKTSKYRSVFCVPLSHLMLDGDTRLRAGQQVCPCQLFRLSPVWDLPVLELLQAGAPA